MSRKSNPDTDGIVWAIRCNGETCPFHIEDGEVRWLEGAEQCEDCASDLAVSATLTGKPVRCDIRCGCGAYYAAFRFVYPISGGV